MIIIKFEIITKKYIKSLKTETYLNFLIHQVLLLVDFILTQTFQVVI